MDGLTFDDVLLIPAYSEVLPRNVDLTTIRKKINFHPNENKIPSEGKINLFRKEQ